MKLDKEFCIFILSHNRANNIATLDMLKRYNYEGMWKVVISDDDKEIEKYKEAIDEEHLLIFKKEDALVYSNTYLAHDCFISSASLYARNYILKYSRENGIKWLIQADDDITHLYHRFIDVNGKLKQKEIESVDEVVKPLMEFMDGDKKIESICPAINSGYFGGPNGNFAKGLTNYAFQFMLMRNTHPGFEGIRTEDWMTSHIHKDRLFLTYWGLSFDSPKMSTNEGGIDYHNEYIFNPYIFILMHDPSCIILKENGKKVIYQNKAFPKWISEEYKKR